MSTSAHTLYMREWRDTPERRAKDTMYRKRYRLLEVTRTREEQALFEARCIFLREAWPCSNPHPVATGLEI